jgi:hypothetical protein
MADVDSAEAAEGVEPMYGMDAIEESDGSAKGRLVPWDPRTVGPRDILNDVRGWLYRYRLYALVVGIAAFGAVYVLGLPSPSVPEWWDVAVVAGGLAVALGYVSGKRTGTIFSNPQYMILDQLDAKTADQLTIRISNERWQDLRVLDHNAEEKPASYLKRKSWNGEKAVECDCYYPEQNVAVASWQAGATNKELREYETKVDNVKTDLEAEANKAIEARVSAEEQSRKQAQEVVNELLEVYEGVTQPGESDLSERLGAIGDEDPETGEAKLEDVEAILRGDHDAERDGNGRADTETGEEPALSERLVERAEEISVDLDPRDDRDHGEGGEP